MQLAELAALDGQIADHVGEFFAAGTPAASAPSSGPMSITRRPPCRRAP